MVTVIGESLIDFIRIPGETSGELFDSHVGGCGLNTATAIGRLGGAVTFCGGISADMFGKRILSHLVQNQVLFDPDLCNLPFPSMIGFASLDARGSATYAFYCKGTAPMSVTTEQLTSVLSINTDIRIVHIGSVSLSTRPTSDAILDTVDFLSPHPVVFFDPNVRPSIIDDFPSYRKKFMQAAKMADIIKLSEEDLVAIYGELPMEDSVARLRSEVKAHVILTRGREGATWFATDGNRVDYPIVPSPVVDTVGAGDTFSGALLYYLQDRGYLGPDGTAPKLAEFTPDAIRDALHFASAAAAINCSRQGCDPPTLAEVMALYDAT